MKKIELKDLRAIPPYKVFGTGNTFLLRWVAQKLPNHHWTIYIGSHFVSDKGIISKNQTLGIDTAKLVINCDSEVWKRYREGGEN